MGISQNPNVRRTSINIVVQDTTDRYTYDRTLIIIDDSMQISALRKIVKYTFFFLFCYI